MYHFKNSITHPDQSIAEKANFFADYFELVAADLGKIGTAELENHKSLLEKILTQLDNHTTHSKKFIAHYFANPYLSSKDLLIKEYYEADWKLINDSKKKYFRDNDPQNLRGAIQPLVDKLNGTLFENIINEVITAILCRYPLSGHNHVGIFEYCTPILVSEFVFAGFNNKDLHDLFRKIFERDILIEGNKVKTKAPLPSELIELKHDPVKFFEAASDYLKNRNLKQQFEGIYFLFKNSIKKRTVIFPLVNVQAYDQITLEYDNVTFSNEFRKKYVKKGARKEFSSFFAGSGRMFASVIVKQGDESTTLKQAVRNVQTSLNYFNATLKSNAQLTTLDYVICEDDDCTRATLFSTVIRDSNRKLFNDSKPLTYLEGVNTKFTRRIITSDKIYFQAMGSLYDEEKLVNLWRYLESFFDEVNYAAKDVKVQVSRILSLECLESFAFVNLNLAKQILYSPDIGLTPERFGVTRDELWQLLHPGLIVNSNFKRIDEIIRHPYVSRQLKWQLSTTDSNKIEQANLYYSRILTEAYEQRNLIEHNGTYNQKAIQKIMLTLPEMVAKFRTTIIKRAKESQIKSFHELLINL